MTTLQKILRPLFYFATLISLLLLLSSLLLWPLSNFRELAVEFTAGKTYCMVDTVRTRAAIYLASPNGPRTFRFLSQGIDPLYGHWSYLTWRTPRDIDDPIALHSTTLGIEIARSPTPPFMGVTVTYIAIPYSYLTLLFSILPLLAFRSLRRRRAARPGLCPKCNYDLRAQHSGAAGAVCPECGTPVAKRP